MFFQEQDFCNGVKIDDLLLHRCSDYDHEKMKPHRPKQVLDPKSGMNTQVRCVDK